MTSIWVSLVAVGGFELHIYKDTRMMFTMDADFSKMIGLFSQATLWKWDEERQEYFGGRQDAVSTGEGDWGKELKL